MATKDENNGTLPRGATSSYNSGVNGGNNGQNNPPANEQSAAPASGNNGNTPAPQTPAVAAPTERKDPYEGFSGSNYAELEDYIRNQMNDVKVETPEERKKRERREKIEGAINGIADMGMALGNLFFTTQYAPNAYNPQNSLSQKYQERMEKAKAEREKDHDRYMNYARTLGKLKDADRDFNFSVAKARQQLQNWQDTFDAAERKNSADDAARRAKLEQDKQRWEEEKELQKQKQAEINRHNQETEQAAMTRAQNTGSSRRQGGSTRGQSGSGKYLWYDRNGKAHYETSEQTAKNMARLAGTYHDSFYKTKDPLTGVETEARSGWYSAPPTGNSGNSGNSGKKNNTNKGDKYENTRRLRL